MSNRGLITGLYYKTFKIITQGSICNNSDSGTVLMLIVPSPAKKKNIMNLPKFEKIPKLRYKTKYFKVLLTTPS